MQEKASVSSGSSATSFHSANYPMYTNPPELSAGSPTGTQNSASSYYRQSVTNMSYANGSTGFGTVPSYNVSSSVMSPATAPSLGSGSAQIAATPMDQPSLEGMYQPPQHHWFYRKEVDKNYVWTPFSVIDSISLEEVLHSPTTTLESLVPTDGGRYDVNVLKRERCAVYWEEEPVEVRRSSWFYRGPAENKFQPYNETFAARLEEEYYNAVTTNSWHRRVEFEGGHSVVMHSPAAMVHNAPPGTPDAWGNIPDGQIRPRVVKRGIDEFDFKHGEPVQVDHLVFMIHGIGSICDFRMRPLVEVVDDFRAVSQQMVQAHFRTASAEGQIGRIEFLPISWHDTLHRDDMGTDKKLKPVTLRTIPKMRFFMNDTLLDILFYTSPVYCQIIMDTVGSEMNRMYSLFQKRNPGFCGRVSLAGHSLGSLIMFDLLQHQPGTAASEIFQKPAPVIPSPAGQEPSLVDNLGEMLEELGLSEYVSLFEDEKIDMTTLQLCTEEDIKEMGVPLGPRKKIMAYVKDNADKLDANHKATTDTSEYSYGDQAARRGSVVSTVSYTVGPAGTGQPSISYPKLDFHPAVFFAMGSPIGMFVAIRGIDRLGEDFRLPTCPAFYNIFHPFDPVAYRIEPLLDPSLVNVRPVLIPHHKGRKRMHLELKETMARVGADLKAKFYDSLKNTWNTLYSFAQYHKGSQQSLEQEVDKAFEQVKKQEDEAVESEISVTDGSPVDETVVGQLNGGLRVDFVLQEAPLESFNEYLFALASHCCYWESEDTILLILKEIYKTMGVSPDTERSKPSIQNMPHIPSPSSRLPCVTHLGLQNSASAPGYSMPSALQAGQVEKQAFAPTQGQTGSSSGDRIQQPQFFQSSDNVNKNFANAGHSLQSPMYPSPPGPPQVTEFNSLRVAEPATVIGSRPVAFPGNQGIGMDPTLPVASDKPVGPPPIGGFVKQPKLGRR